MRKEYFGIGKIEKVKDIIEDLGAKKIFLVCGRKSFEASGAKRKIMPYISNYEIYYSPTNPSIDVVKSGIEFYNKFEPDLVIAVGGGSVIDSAKIINALAPYPDNIISFIIKKRDIEKDIKPLVAIPTTAGSGSEATKFATIYIGRKKYSLENEKILPSFTIIDPSLTFSMPRYVTAYTGLDALCQAIESYWSVNSTAESRRYAKESMKLSYENIVRAVEGDKSARVAMAKSAFLSGKAINISKTTACHSISYPLTAYFDIPHGHAVALTLPEFIEYNFMVEDHDCNDPRGAGFVKNRIEEILSILNLDDVKEAKKNLRDLIAAITGKAYLGNFNVNKSKIDIIVNNISSERMKNNPRKVGKEELKKILMAII